MTTDQTQKLTALIQAARELDDAICSWIPAMNAFSPNVNLILRNFRCVTADAEAVLRENEAPLDAVTIDAIRLWFLRRLSEENCMGTIVDVFTSIREDLEKPETFRDAIYDATEKITEESP